LQPTLYKHLGLCYNTYSSYTAITQGVANSEIFIRRSDGSLVLHDSNGNRRSAGENALDIWAMPVGGGDVVPLVQSPYRDVDPSWTWWMLVGKQWGAG